MARCYGGCQITNNHTNNKIIYDFILNIIFATTALMKLAFFESTKTEPQFGH